VELKKRTSEKGQRTKSVLIATKEFPPGPGGIGTYAYKIAVHLHRMGWKVSVVAEQQRTSGKEAEEFNASLPFTVKRMRLLPIGPIKGLYRLLVIASSILRTRPEIILASHAQMVWIATLLRPFFRCPIVAIGYGSEFLYPPGWRRSTTKWSFSRVSGVVNISRFTENLMSAGGISAIRQTMIPPGADSEDFEDVSLEDVEDLRQRHGLQSAKVILTVALISERKGQNIIIRAMPEILKRVPNAHYVIVGVPEKPAIKQEYEALAGELGVQNRVHFVGKAPQSELPLYYHLCDVFALTSRKSACGSVEGYGIVAVEAALCGKPSVVTEGSGLTEAIVPGETGLSVPQDNPRKTAEAITALLENDELRRKMGEAARERAWSSQGWDKRIVEYDRFLSELIS